MRGIGAALVAMTMTVCSAFTVDGALAPGKPAGKVVHHSSSMITALPAWMRSSSMGHSGTMRSIQ